MVKKEKIRTKFKEKLRRPDRTKTKKNISKYRTEEDIKVKKPKGNKRQCKKLLDEAEPYTGYVDVAEFHKNVMNIIKKKR